jgi:hypothetical protein
VDWDRGEWTTIRRKGWRFEISALFPPGSDFLCSFLVLLCLLFPFGLLGIFPFPRTDTSKTHTEETVTEDERAENHVCNGRTDSGDWPLFFQLIHKGSCHNCDERECRIEGK